MALIQVGDMVRIRFMEPLPTMKNSNQRYRVETIPDNTNLGNPFWEFSLNGDLFAVSSPVVVIKEFAIP